jgi:hypothetical protein
MSEVTDLLDRLVMGRVELRAVAADFATRRWATAERRPANSHAEAAVREGEDFEPIPENSWGEVEAAYISGRINDDQYRVLFAARTGPRFGG